MALGREDRLRGVTDGHLLGGRWDAPHSPSPGPPGYTWGMDKYRVVAITTNGTRATLCEYLKHRDASHVRAGALKHPEYWKVIVERMKPIAPPQPIAD